MERGRFFALHYDSVRFLEAFSVQHRKRQRIERAPARKKCRDLPQKRHRLFFINVIIVADYLERRDARLSKARSNSRTVGSVVRACICISNIFIFAPFANNYLQSIQNPMLSFEYFSGEKFSSFTSFASIESASQITESTLPPIISVPLSV